MKYQEWLNRKLKLDEQLRTGELSNNQYLEKLKELGQCSLISNSTKR